MPPYSTSSHWFFPVFCLPFCPLKFDMTRETSRPYLFKMLLMLHPRTAQHTICATRPLPHTQTHAHVTWERICPSHPETVANFVLLNSRPWMVVRIQTRDLFCSAASLRNPPTVSLKVCSLLLVRFLSLNQSQIEPKITFGLFSLWIVSQNN